MRREENFVDKSTWGEGEWQEEPDKVQYKDEETGLDCLIVRHSSGGHLCGYVGVPPEHPFYGKNYDDVKQADGDYIRVHGGLTYSDNCQENGHICHVPELGEPDDIWWLGFDCAHAGDKSPGFQSSLKLAFTDVFYATMAFVERENRDLARQVKEAA